MSAYYKYILYVDKFESIVYIYSKTNLNIFFQKAMSQLGNLTS
jgi:hypothetical protein